jgi:signal transduction histidine kinase/CheY-like chemotaxis protein
MFKLSRYFSITSLIAFVGVTILLSFLYPQIILNDLTAIAESKNVAITQAFANSVWPDFATFVTSASELPPDELLNAPEIEQLRQAVLAEMAGLSIVKVKLYDLNGLTVFSTEAAQIGQDKSDNEGFARARAGQTASELTYRETFSAFEETIEDRNVYSSYIPIRPDGGQIEGVFELYDDVTPLIERIEASQRTVFLSITGILALLYGALFLIVRRADKIIQQQHFKLTETAAALAKASQAKSEFLSNMSHELRTPLNGVLGYAQILKREKNLSAAQSKGLDIIYQSGHHLLTLINDILDLSKIEARKMELDPTEVHLESLLSGIVGIIGMKAEEKQLLFTLEADELLPVGFLADEKRLRQILLNLLGNAVKFTQQGRVTLKVERLSDERDYGPLPTSTIRFEVSDSGVGMSPEALEKIFLPFEQVGNSQSRAQGTGLGLAITQQLVTLMGSQMKVKSEAGKGSTFCFDLTLPILSTSVEQIGWRRKQSTAVIGYQGEPRKILVVDDKLENRLVLSNMLSPLGFEVVQAENGQECVDLTPQIQPDLILTDLVMPVMTGFEAVKEIRKRPSLQKLPIIAISASVFDMDQKQSRLAGCDAFLAKPVDEQKLLAMIGSHLKLEWIYKDTPASKVAAQESPLLPPPQEELEALYELAMLGNIKRIGQYADHLEQLHKKYVPFAKQVRQLARAFEDEKIVALVEQYLNDN